MARYRKITNSATGEVILARARWCASWWCRFRGLMLRADLPADEGLLFVHRRASRIDATIHMLFMLIPIGVVWLDADRRVVDAKLAKPWRLAYAPAKPAQYYIEAVPDILGRVSVGDVLEFEP
ncbi:MAG: DUF192 domain-containing protein [Anaerolineales bacterium]